MMVTWKYLTNIEIDYLFLARDLQNISSFYARYLEAIWTTIFNFFCITVVLILVVNG